MLSGISIVYHMRYSKTQRSSSGEKPRDQALLFFGDMLNWSQRIGESCPSKLRHTNKVVWSEMSDKQ
jgi:hypothetical protein